MNASKELPYTYVVGDTGIDNDDLDQEFGLEEGLFMSMMNCDLIQTKNLALNELHMRGDSSTS